MTQLLGSKGLLGYVDGKVTLPLKPNPGDPASDATLIYSTTPSYDEWNFQDQLAWRHITLNCVDITRLSSDNWNIKGGLVLYSSRVGEKHRHVTIPCTGTSQLNPIH